MMGRVLQILSRLGLVRRWDQWFLTLFMGWAPGWPRDRLIFVTGFHHCGTTLVQSQLHRQGVFTFFHEAPDGSGSCRGKCRSATCTVRARGPAGGATLVHDEAAEQ